MSCDDSGQFRPEDQGVAPQAPDLPEADNPDHSGDHGDRPEDAGRDGGPKINVLSTEREKVIRYTDHYTIELLDTDRDIYQRSVCPDLDGGLLGGGPAGCAGGLDDFGRHAVPAHSQMVVGGGADGGGEPGGVLNERGDLKKTILITILSRAIGDTDHYTIEKGDTDHYTIEKHLT